MARQNEMFLIPFVLILGMVAGGMILLSIGTSSGIMTFQPMAEETVPASATPATDHLNMYSCRQGETKHLLLGGIEDNYSTAELEPVKYTAVESDLLGGNMEAGRLYDEPGQDKVFHDYFKVDGEIAHGVFVLKARSLTNYENDSLTLTLGKDPTRPGNYYQTIAISDIGTLDMFGVEPDFIYLSPSQLESLVSRDEKIKTFGDDCPAPYLCTQFDLEFPGRAGAYSGTGSA